MKELSIEEKAKAYDEAIKRVENIKTGKCQKTFMFTENLFEYILPALKESEDERIKNEIIAFVEQSIHRGGGTPIPQEQENKWIAWLEKQGENISLPKFTYDDVLALQCCMETVKKVQEDKELYEQLQSLHDRLHDTYWLEKQGEQNPADKVEPKFHEGEWITDGKFIVGQVISKNEEYYHYICNGIEQPLYIPNTYQYHLWTIQDAKDGDVLVASDGSIFIFKDTIDCACKHYVALTTDNVIKINDGLEYYWETSRAVYPATKEQRDLLFQKMKEAGYEWDDEKKEPKKIEQNPADEVGNYDHEKVLQTIINKQKPVTIDIDKMVNDYANNKEPGNEEFGKPVGCMIRAYRQGLNDAIRKVEQKPTWSEEDENALGDALWCCRQAVSIAKNENAMGNIWYAEKWLKALKNRYTWKPSDEQIMALRWVLNHIPYDSHKEEISGLLEQLKKLKGKVMK